MPAALAAGKYEGRLYRVPMRTDVGLLHFRRDLLRRAGRAPPETFEQLVGAARALQSPPTVWGFVWQGKQYEGLICNDIERAFSDPRVEYLHLHIARPGCDNCRVERAERQPAGPIALRSRSIRRGPRPSRGRTRPERFGRPRSA